MPQFMRFIAEASMRKTRRIAGDPAASAPEDLTLHAVYGARDRARPQECCGIIQTTGSIRSRTRGIVYAL
jgi:hypothetical protein